MKKNQFKKNKKTKLTFVARYPRDVVWWFFVLFAWFVGSRHLVFNWGLLENPDALILSEIHG
jgi:hypothetical protein